jgi:DNA end-binding protein Ku
MKSTWQGTVTFGLVSIPVNIYTATEDSGPALNYVHEHDGGRVSQQWVCKDCGERIEYSQLAKGHEIGRDEDKRPIMVCLSADELKSLDAAKSRQAQVLEFVDAGDVPTEQYGQLYYLAPQPPKRASRSSALPAPNTRGYSILRETLRSSGLVALVSITLRNREQRAMLTVSGNTIVMRMLLWSAQVRPHEFYDWEGGTWPEEQLSHDELDMAAALVHSMAGKYDPSAHVDAYAAGLSAMIEAKRPVDLTVVPEPSNVVSLLGRLDSAVAMAGA